MHNYTFLEYVFVKHCIRARLTHLILQMERIMGRYHFQRLRLHYTYMRLYWKNITLVFIAEYYTICCKI